MNTTAQAEWKWIEIMTSGGARKIRAVVVGAWAAHERWNVSDEGWVVTHVDAGLNLGFPGELTASEAISTAYALHKSGLSDANEIVGERWLIEAIVAEALS